MHFCQQIKDILKGSLRFNQSQLEAEENEQITIEDDHYCSSNLSKRAAENIENLSAPKQFVPLLKEVKCMLFSEILEENVSIKKYIAIVQQ